MTLQIQLVKGLFQKSVYKHQLQKAEAFTGYKRKLIGLFLLSIAVFALNGLFGIGSEAISKEWSTLKDSEFEARKQLFLMGRMISGLVFPTVFIFLSALIFWTIFEVEYKKLVVIQMLAFCISLLEQAIQIPIFIGLEINHLSNPLSLGVIAQYVTKHSLVIQFFSGITVFQVLIISFITSYLSYLSERTWGFTVIVVSLLYMFYWFVSAFLGYVNIGMLF
ncbi:hypothetical protein [Peribacillus alkalitolerans]|uniref:hypothetical protein n=1 Tax=Peribacillus alkalitolerans TaxID=1550385 RepID=UPI0013D7A721|nr:hypothetical protein [Peribacillus alkalitolerans]